MENINSNPDFQIEKPSKRILEIGAGVRSIIELLGDDLKDVDLKVVSDFNKKFFIEKENGVEKVVADVYHLPFGDKSFDDILAMNFFGDPAVGHQVYDYNSITASQSSIELMFVELHRVLKDGGEICVIEHYTPDTAIEFFNHYKNVWEKYFSYSNESSFISEKDLFDKFYPWRRGNSFVHSLKKKTNLN